MKKEATIIEKKYAFLPSQFLNAILYFKIIPMKRIIILLVFIFLGVSAASAQKVYSCNYRSDADVKVYVTEYKSDADLIVYKCDYRSDAQGNHGYWYFVEYRSDADKKIYFTDYRSEADLKIYFTEYRSEAGWKNKEKQHLMY